VTTVALESKFEAALPDNLIQQGLTGQRTAYVAEPSPVTNLVYDRPSSGAFLRSCTPQRTDECFRTGQLRLGQTEPREVVRELRTGEFIRKD
jgi:hypothetical protein